MSRKEPKTKPVPLAEGFYMTTMLPNDEPNVTHFKYSMPVYVYVSVLDEMLENPEAMADVSKDTIDLLIYQIESQIKEYKAKERD